jgi:hypothetical protein
MHDDDIKLNSLIKGGKTRKSKKTASRRKSRVNKRRTLRNKISK